VHHNALFKTEKVNLYNPSLPPPAYAVLSFTCEMGEVGKIIRCA